VLVENRGLGALAVGPGGTELPLHVAAEEQVSKKHLVLEEALATDDK
jgi:hypothetical protein